MNAVDSTDGPVHQLLKVQQKNVGIDAGGGRVVAEGSVDADDSVRVRGDRLMPEELGDDPSVEFVWIENVRLLPIIVNRC